MAFRCEVCFALAFIAILASAQDAGFEQDQDVSVEQEIDLELDNSVADIFFSYDIDKDGKLSAEEFTAMVPQHDADLARRRAQAPTTMTTLLGTVPESTTMSAAFTPETAQPSTVVTTTFQLEAPTMPPSPRKPSFVVRVFAVVMTIVAVTAVAIGVYRYRWRRGPMADEDHTEQPQACTAA